jgi:hypothetical protein
MAAVVSPEARPVVLGFSLSFSETVDECYRELTASSYTGRQDLRDAFFGAR